jgi:hypothetical protein
MTTNETSEYLRRLGYFICEVHERWKLYRSLYLVDAERVETLNTRTGHVFAIVQFGLMDGLLLEISKLFDPAGRGTRETVSLAGAVERTAYCGTAELMYLRVKADSILANRNKRIAHNDRLAAMGLVSPPGVSAFLITEVLDSAGDFFNALSVAFEGTTFGFDAVNTDVAYQAEILVEVLRLGHEARGALRKGHHR